MLPTPTVPNVTAEHLGCGGAADGYSAAARADGGSRGAAGAREHGLSGFRTPEFGVGSACLATLVPVKNPRSAWITYTALRLLFFAVPFALLYVLGLSLQFSMMVSALIAAVLAALISVSLSVLLLSKSRETASESIYEWRNRDRTADDIIEDDAMDAAEAAEVAGAAASGEAASAEPRREADADPAHSDRP